MSNENKNIIIPSYDKSRIADKPKPVPKTEQFFRETFGECIELMRKKNNDYGESWRLMRVQSITDQILTKIHRVRQIEENDGHSEISEGRRSEYIDIINYCVFAIYKLDESDEQ